MLRIISFHILLKKLWGNKKLKNEINKLTYFQVVPTVINESDEKFINDLKRKFPKSISVWNQKKKGLISRFIQIENSVKGLFILLKCFKQFGDFMDLYGGIELLNVDFPKKFLNLKEKSILELDNNFQKILSEFIKNE